MGIIFAIADGEEIKTGDKVVYDRHKQQLMEVRGEKLTLVKVEDVIASVIGVGSMRLLCHVNEQKI